MEDDKDESYKETGKTDNSPLWKIDNEGKLKTINEMKFRCVIIMITNIWERNYRPELRKRVRDESLSIKLGLTTQGKMDDVLRPENRPKISFQHSEKHKTFGFPVWFPIFYQSFLLLSRWLIIFQRE